MTFRPVHKALAAVLFLVGLAYSNHFRNSFHFDDSHTVEGNPWIRDIANIPRFFTDGTTFSTLPSNRTYRPVVSASLAVDYRLGHGLDPLWFHISTFFWFLIQLALMFLLFRRLVGDWSALAATAIYGVHPAMAETVNYIIQRGDVYATLGVVAALAVYALAPNLRRFGLYLVPLALAVLSKPPALVFPLLLFAWIALAEGERLVDAARLTVPSLLAVAALGIFTSRMNPPSFNPGTGTGYFYRISQPQVLMEYFGKFLVPTGLTADTDHVAYTSLFQTDVLLGFAFVAALCVVIVRTWRNENSKPIAFGLFWFLAASIPTSIYPLAELENDHRMYFPFVGLSVAFVHTVALWFEDRKFSRQFRVAALVALLAAFAWGTRERNVVWATEESLWQDVTVKSPKNGRGLMNYGLTQMSKGNNALAIQYFERALTLTPDYYTLETNLGISYGIAGDAVKADAHFQRAVALAPREAVPHYFYARWLDQNGRRDDAFLQASIAKSLNPDITAARYLLMQIYVETGRLEALLQESQECLVRFPGDATAASYMAGARAARLGQTGQVQTGQQTETPEAHLERSLALFQAHRYQECIAEAEAALKLRPDYAEAYNNIAAAYNALGDLDRGIAAAREAVRIKPDFQLARNNLAWALDQQKSRPAGRGN